jgi:ATP-dependent RNA helicase DHX29
MDDSSRQVSAVEEVDVSDLDSDMEPDQLVPKYLDIKTRLFEISPEAVEPKHRRNKSKRQATSTLPESSSSVRKLQAQLRHIEADALFDQYDADTKWMTKRNQLAQDRITSKKLGLEETHAPVNTTYWEPHQSQGADKETATSSTSLDAAPKDEEDDPTELSMFSEMFSPVPDDDSAISAPEVGQDSTSQTIKLRDFGKQSGLTPRRVLEETVRARDPEAKLAFKLVSPTTYACRHSLVVRWSKDQEVAFEEDIPGVQCDAGYRSVTFTAVSISTPSVQQSEAYISTAALYSIFSGSTKEDKSYIRLPSVWRDLYKEFLEVKKDRNDALDRATIKELRSIVKEQVDREEDEGVVLTNRFRKRNQASGAVSEAEDSGRDEARFVANAERLKELWAQKSRTPAYQRMLVSRMNLPIFAFRAAALQTIDHHQVTIVCGETGCGKSTQLPAFILENELSKGKPCKIYCTEPRRISAISLAQRVSEELGEFKNELGTSRSLVGYAIRLESNTSAQTRLVYATVGIVLRMLESSRGLDDITHLIIDEVHERRYVFLFLLIMSLTMSQYRYRLSSYHPAVSYGTSTGTESCSHERYR